MRKLMQLFSLTLLLLFVVSCSSVNSADVPITDGWHQSLDAPTTYVVKKSDTVYSIAWRYGIDYRDLATSNGLDSSYHIKVGQKLLLTSAKVKAPVQKKSIVITKADTAASSLDSIPTSGIRWTWPASSHQVINKFSATSLNKGIDITGKIGSPVFAAAAGKVVYSGNGLRGYGNLLIIKHNAEFLSAYAHNDQLLVRQGQTVQMGAVIAKMGDTEAKQVILHFEIRKAGKPVDPLKYLPAN